MVTFPFKKHSVWPADMLLPDGHYCDYMCHNSSATTTATTSHWNSLYLRLCYIRRKHRQWTADTPSDVNKNNFLRPRPKPRQDRCLQVTRPRPRPRPPEV